MRYLVTIFVTLVLGLFQSSAPAHAGDGDPGCYDEDRIFKMCPTSLESVREKIQRATTNKKIVIALYGRDNCPWSRSMFGILFSSDKVRLGGAEVVVISSQVLSGYPEAPLFRKADYLSRVLGHGLEFTGNVPVLFILKPGESQWTVFNPADFEQDWSYKTLKKDGTIEDGSWSGYNVESLSQAISESIRW